MTFPLQSIITAAGVAHLLACNPGKNAQHTASTSAPTHTGLPAVAEPPAGGGASPAYDMGGVAVAPVQAQVGLACDSEDLDKCLSLAAMAYEQSGEKAPALALMDSLCRRKHAQSCYRLGILRFYDGGEELALDAWARGCETGHQISCVRAAKVMAYGNQAQSADWSKVFELLLKACDAQELSGCLELSNLYRDGLGTKKDGEKAAHYKRLAIEYGYGE